VENLFNKQSAKFIQNRPSFIKVMVKQILVCFFMPHSVHVQTEADAVRYKNLQNAEKGPNYHIQKAACGYTEPPKTRRKKLPVSSMTTYIRLKKTFLGRIALQKLTNQEHHYVL